MIEQVRPDTNIQMIPRLRHKQAKSRGVTRFNGVACPSDGSLKINGSSGLH
ncbi:hypothetical protein [Rhizobium beringeri]|uniref:hypothetical protein n=1 Tax=Rhizobium beringeri TaxID=3019934 RepID=UPI003B59AF2A